MIFQKISLTIRVDYKLGVRSLTNGENRRKEVLVDFEEKMSLANAATYFETIANKLSEEGSFTLTHNGQTIEVKPSSTVELEIKVVKMQDKQKFEIELEWTEGTEDTTLKID
ncbi:amphi-Trp domain-containing protein [Sporosarcina pasteurii]|nr:amphi-Trp domain-containing protein [Sporosarcina pasteurii]